MEISKITFAYFNSKINRQTLAIPRKFYYKILLHCKEMDKQIQNSHEVQCYRYKCKIMLLVIANFPSLCFPKQSVSCNASKTGTPLVQVLGRSSLHWRDSPLTAARGTSSSRLIASDLGVRSSRTSLRTPRLLFRRFRLLVFVSVERFLAAVTIRSGGRAPLERVRRGKTPGGLHCARNLDRGITFIIGSQSARSLGTRCNDCLRTAWKARNGVCRDRSAILIKTTEIGFNSGEILC